MSVHYKFKSTLDYDTITFDGLHISVADLKKAILQQKRLSKITDFDLQIINAQTKEEYQHDTSLIPKNTSLIISRVPIANQTKKSWDASTRTVQTRVQTKVDSADFDLSKMEGSEEDKIQAMMVQSTAEYDPKSYQKIRGYSQTGDVPATYRCNKCKKGGHWIKNCPYTISKEHTVEKRTTGIPKSFRDKDDRAMMIESQDTIVEEDKKQEIPEDLLCSICNDLFVDAVMIPCCGSSFCDDCVRNALLDSEDNECPDCKEKGSSPGSLIPNRFLRNSVNAFKNRTGYKASSQIKKEAIQNPKESYEVKNNEEKETESEFPRAEGIDAETEHEDKKTNEVAQKKEESDTKLLMTTVVVREATDDVKIQSDELKHKTVNVSNSPTHEDSDYEDNIVVTVPSASDTRTEKYLNRRHSSNPKPPGIEQNSPKSKNQISPYHQDSSSNRSSEPSGHISKEWETNSIEKIRDHHENTNGSDHYKYDKGRIIPLAKPVENLQPPGANAVAVPLYPPHQSYDMQQQRPIRPMNMHSGFHNHMHRTPLYPHPNMPAHHPPHQMRLPMPTLNSYDPSYNSIGNVAPGYQRFPSTMPNRFNYPIREAEHQNPMRPFNSIASVYEEVAAKVGVGIIDDPLEAFNRIMKEKEKKKDERRSPDRRRRSKDRHTRGNFRVSPFNSRLKDHGYHDKRGRSRDRDNDRRWARYGKTIDKERDRERERERERERDREHDRDKNSGYRSRRSKSLDRSSRSRTHSPPSKRYRSPPSIKAYSAHEKHPHHYHQKLRLDEPDDSFDNRQKRDQGRSMGNSLKSLDTKVGTRQQIDNEEKNTDLRKPYNINDENSEPPPPGFELHTTRNPFHTNNITFSPSSNRDRDIPPRNNTPDLYEKCVSQDMEENKFYNIGSKSDQRFKSRSQTRSRSHSRSSLRISEKRRKIHRSTTPKGKPCDNHTKREKENTLSSSSHSQGKRRSEDRHSKKDKEFNEHESKRRSMTPPRQKDAISDQNQTSSETDQKDKSESKKSERKLKDRKKKRREKSERKKVKKEKKSKKERHRLKSENNNYTASKDCGNDELSLTANNNGVENENKSGKELNKNENVEEGQHPSVEKMLCSNSTPKIERNDSTLGENVGTPNQQQQQQSNEYDEKTTTLSDIKSFDAVLDIHEYETDFDDNNLKLQENTSKFVPKASKWELEDQINTFSQYAESNADENQAQNNLDSKITNDVIVRAEKAIFARAINAIRPSEVRRKSTSKEKSSKCYGDDHENIRNIQITLPVNISKERSIEVKNDTSNNEKKKSIKDRLGSKINQPLYSQLGETRKESDHSFKSSYAPTDRDAGIEPDRRNKSTIDNKVNNNKRIETEKGNRFEKNRDRSHEKNRIREKDKDRCLDKERSRHRERDNLDKDRDKERDSDKNRERLRDQRHAYHSEGERKSFQCKSRDYKISKVEKLRHSSDRERREHDGLTRKRHHSHSSPISQRKLSPSFSNSNSDDEDRKRKHAKSDKKSRKRSDSPESDSGKKSIKKKNKSDKKKKKKSKK